MSYPTKEVGQLIRKHRLLQNMSQESLCSGICAISYLSKIESGTVTANTEIIESLFRTLHIDFITDAHFINQGTHTIISFFKAYFFDYDTECDRLFGLLEKDESSYLFSPLLLDYQLVKAYHYLEKNDPLTLTLYTDLSECVQNFSPSQYFYFLYLEGAIHFFFTKDYTLAIQKLSAANSLRLSANVLSLLAHAHFCAGSYPIAIDTAENAFKIAIDEGNISCCLTTCLLQANAYSNMKNVFLMLKYYKKALNLCEGIGNLKDKQHIYYNLGATLLILGDYDKALVYCLQSLALAQINHDTPLLLYHKLAIIYLELRNKSDAKAYLDLAYTALNTHDSNDNSLFKLFLDLITLRLEDDYYLYNPDYLHLLESIYYHADPSLHHGFKQFHGDYLIACYKATRRYKDALRITEELYVTTPYFPKDML